MATFRTSSPRGTTLALVLPHPQLVLHQLMLPEGTSLQGDIVSVRTRGHVLPVYQIQLRSADLILPDGTAMPLKGDLTAQADEAALPYETYLPRKKDWAFLGAGTAIAVGSVAVGSAKEASAFNASMPSMPSLPSPPPFPTPFQPLPTPTLPPMPTVSHTGMKIALIGGLIGAGVALVPLFGQRNNAIVYAGAPLEVTLSQPLQLNAVQVRNAAKSAKTVTIQAPPDHLSASQTVDRTWEGATILVTRARCRCPHLLSGLRCQSGAFLGRFVE
jgi:hypothetical protein